MSLDDTMLRREGNVQNGEPTATERLVVIWGVDGGEGLTPERDGGLGERTGMFST